MENKEIRIRILRMLYDSHFNSPGTYVGREKIKEKLRVNDNILDANMIYLEQAGLVELLKTLGSVFAMAKITNLGIDEIEKE